MYIENLTTLLVEATEALFGEDFPYPDMRDLSVHIDYPLDVALYPGVWVQWVPQGDVRNVGIGHVEIRELDNGGLKQVYRWKFSGICELTIHALSTLERARMIDWLAKAIAFGQAESSSITPLSPFRQMIEQNDLIGVTVLWGSFTIGGQAETPGTPWGTDDVVYEETLSLAMEGEYVFDPEEGTLTPLSAIVVEDPEVLPTLPSTPEGAGWV